MTTSDHITHTEEINNLKKVLRCLRQDEQQPAADPEGLSDGSCPGSDPPPDVPEVGSDH